jgi:hypothetical protein
MIVLGFMLTAYSATNPLLQKLNSRYRPQEGTHQTSTIMDAGNDRAKQMRRSHESGTKSVKSNNQPVLFHRVPYLCAFSLVKTGTTKTRSRNLNMTKLFEKKEYQYPQKKTTSKLVT